jgi:hypothetical protein
MFKIFEGQQLFVGDSRDHIESCRGNCNDFFGLGLPDCDAGPNENWLYDGQPRCNKKTLFEQAPSMCVVNGGNNDRCPKHYKQVQRCFVNAACNGLDTHRAVCLKNAWTEVPDLLELVKGIKSMPEEAAYLRGGDDERRYDCCAGNKISDPLACDTGYCEDSIGTTNNSKCHEHMQTYCQVLRGQYPKKNGKVQPRTGENSLTSDLQAITTESDLSVYTWLSDDYPGCACWDSDYADFVKQQQKVVLISASGANITTNLPSNLLCWFDPCVNAHARMSWLNPSCGNIQVCVQYQNNEINVASGGHVNLDDTTINNELACNFESGGGDGVPQDILERIASLEAAASSSDSGSDSKDDRIKLYLLIGGIISLFIVLLLLFGGLGAEKPNKTDSGSDNPSRNLSGDADKRMTGSVLK